MKKTLAILVAASAMSCTAVASNPFGGTFSSGHDLDYLYNGTAGYENTDWMSHLPDTTRLADISIPGTHNSLAVHGGAATQTQTLDIISQLEMGIRYLDLRFKYMNNELVAYNGSSSLHTRFEEVMATVDSFLRAHPSETVLMRIKNEAGSDVDVYHFYKRFTDVAKLYQSRFARGAETDSQIGSLRGKFVFIDDFDSPRDIGIERKKVDIQDRNKVATNWDLHDKWDKVKNHFLYTQNTTRMSVNYLSGSSDAFPYFVASGKSSAGSHDPQLWTGLVLTKDDRRYPDFPRVACTGLLCSVNFAGTNQLASDWIIQKGYRPNLGVVVADFPGGRLVDRIIRNNSSQKPNRNKVEIFEHYNFAGSKLDIKGDTPNLGNFNGKLSSYRMPDGWKVRFYEGINYTGGYYTRSGYELSAEKFNDRIRSIRILESHTISSKNPNNKVELFEHENYEGSKLEITKDTPDLRDFNRKLSSFSIPAGWIVRFYEGTNYTGAFYTRNHNELVTRVFNDRIRSVRILHGNDKSWPDNRLEIFEHSHFEGRKLEITRDTPDLGDFNGKLSSFAMPDGWVVRFYEGTNYTGRYYTRIYNEYLTTDFNDRTRSIRILSKG